MLNLAALQYRNILAKDGGPIETISSREFPILGQHQYQANAYLRPDLVSAKKQQFKAYGNADGSGSSTSAQVARHMAISEALERWAFHTEVDGSRRSLFAFDHDRSSNGLAAFPCLFESQVRSRAFYEALERWSLVSWWDERIDATIVDSPLPGVKLLRLHHGGPSGEVVIAFRKSGAGQYSYGHAAGRTVMGAASRASVELARNEFVVSYFKLRGKMEEVTDYFERRMLYFATPEGHDEFLRRAVDGATKSAPQWQVRCDREVDGPWSKYAKVWRVCAAMPTQEFLNRSANFFFW